MEKKILVVYKSKTGFAKKYAEIIGKELSCEVVELTKVTKEKMSTYDEIIYGGGLYAGTINGFKNAKEMFEKSKAKQFVVFACGATPNAVKEKIDEIWKVNLAEEENTIPHFYMQAGLCYERMSFFDKVLMKIMAKALSKQENKNEVDAGMEQAISSSFDISSEEYVKPLVNYIQEQKNEEKN